VSIECFLKRLNIYTKVQPTPTLKEIAVKIMVEVLSTIALATKQIKQGRLSESIPANPAITGSSIQRRKTGKEAFRRK
jgi:hypothetical protein